MDPYKVHVEPRRRIAEADAVGLLGGSWGSALLTFY